MVEYDTALEACLAGAALSGMVVCGRSLVVRTTHGRSWLT